MRFRKSIAALAVLTAIFTVACESDQDPGVGDTLARVAISERPPFPG